MTTVRVEIESYAYDSDAIDLRALEEKIQTVMHDHGEDVGSLVVVLADDTRLRDLNLEFRAKNETTDVLSFDLRNPVPHQMDELGEIYISLERARAQAQEVGRPLQEELAHLSVHGALHLLGYDHNSDAEWEKMRAREQRYLEFQS